MPHFLDLARIDFAALRAGEPAEWRDFLCQCDPVLRSIVSWSKWHFDVDTREEVVQATRTSLAQALPTLTSNAALPAFVRRICANRCIDAVRRHVRERERAPVALRDRDDPGAAINHAEDGAYDPVRAVLLAERAASLRLAMGVLDAPCQTAIRDFYVKGHSYKAMAEHRKVAVNTIGSRLSRCLDKLRALLGEQAA